MAIDRSLDSPLPEAGEEDDGASALIGPWPIYRIINGKTDSLSYLRVIPVTPIAPYREERHAPVAIHQPRRPITARYETHTDVV